MRPLSTIAHYRITAKLGEGGMGEVWRATDTRLNRDVAIKILPDAFAQDADRLARFTREAQVLASLNHPNIAVIYGVEERALIMELVEGATLSERISQGAIAPEEALPIAGQIAEAQMERIFAAGDDTRAVLRLVKTGARRGNRVEILAGLDEGERVLVAPPTGLREGQPLEIQQIGRAHV